MKIIKSIEEMQTWSARARRLGYSIGFVPTMGALHQGHLSLVRRARRENDAVVASIFVNPLQFGPKEDFKKYPRTLAKDLALLKKDQADIAFVPSTEDMYEEGQTTRVQAPFLDGILEGATRP